MIWSKCVVFSGSFHPVSIGFFSQNLRHPQRSHPRLTRSRLRLQPRRPSPWHLSPWHPRMRAPRSLRRTERSLRAPRGKMEERGRRRKSESHQRASVHLWTLRYFTLIALLSVNIILTSAGWWQTRPFMVVVLHSQKRDLSQPYSLDSYQTDIPSLSPFAVLEESRRRGCLSDRLLPAQSVFERAATRISVLQAHLK